MLIGRFLRRRFMKRRRRHPKLCRFMKRRLRYPKRRAPEYGRLTKVFNRQLSLLEENGRFHRPFFWAAGYFYA
jgi:hypothetical protein